MLIFYALMVYVLSILFSLDDLEELHEEMLFWSFKFWLNYAVMSFIFDNPNCQYGGGNVVPPFPFLYMFQAQFSIVGWSLGLKCLLSWVCISCIFFLF